MNNHHNAIDIVSSYISQAFINLDYNKALNLYSECLQSILHKILIYTKNNSNMNENITNLIHNDTDIHTIIINAIQILKEQSLSSSSSSIEPKALTKKNMATTLCNVQQVLDFMEKMKHWLYLNTSNFKYFLLKVIDLNINDLLYNRMSPDTIQRWKIVYDNIINNYQYNSNNLYLVNTIWYQQLRIIYFLYSLLLFGGINNIQTSSSSSNDDQQQQQQQLLINEIRIRLDTTKTENDKLKQDKDKLKAELNDLQRQYTETIDKNTKEYTETIKKITEDDSKKLQYYQEEMTRKKMTIDDVEQKNRNLHDEYLNLKTKYDEIIIQNKDLNNRIEHYYKAYYEEIKQIIDNDEEEEEGISKDVKMNQNESLQTRITRILQNRKYLKSQLQSFKFQLSNNDNDKQYEIIIQNLQTNINEKEKDLNNLKKKNNEMIKDMEQIVEQSNSYKKELKDIEILVSGKEEEEEEKFNDMTETNVIKRILNLLQNKKRKEEQLNYQLKTQNSEFVDKLHKQRMDNDTEKNELIQQLREKENAVVYLNKTMEMKMKEYDEKIKNMEGKVYENLKQFEKINTGGKEEEKMEEGEEEEEEKPNLEKYISYLIQNQNKNEEKLKYQMNELENTYSLHFKELNDEKGKLTQQLREKERIVETLNQMMEEKMKEYDNKIKSMEDKVFNTREKYRKGIKKIITEEEKEEIKEEEKKEEEDEDFYDATEVKMEEEEEEEEEIQNLKLLLQNKKKEMKNKLIHASNNNSQLYMDNMLLKEQLQESTSTCEKYRTETNINLEMYYKQLIKIKDKLLSPLLVKDEEKQEESIQQIIDIIIKHLDQFQFQNDEKLKYLNDMHRNIESKEKSLNVMIENLLTKKKKRKS